MDTRPVELAVALELKNHDEPLASAEMNARMALEHYNRGELGKVFVPLMACVAILASMAEEQE